MPKDNNNPEDEFIRSIVLQIHVNKKSYNMNNFNYGTSISSNIQNQYILKQNKTQVLENVQCLQSNMFQD